jgi:transcription-repair coupling factor (superfamily II helicase)
MIGLGLRRAARLPVVAAMHRLVDHPVLLVTDRADHALNLYDELGLWCPKDVLLYFPEPSAMFYEKAGWGETTRRERLVGLAKLAAYHIPGAQNEADPHDKHPLLVAPVRALMTRTLPRREFLKATRSLRIHQTVQPEALARSLVILGYEYVNTVILPGQFTRRGGILDVWPMAAEKPTRIEFFGDEIETLRNFDPASQRTIQTQDRLLITPAREFLPPAGPESMPESFSEFDIPRLHPSPASLLDYLPYQALVFFDDYQVTQDQVAELEEQAIQLRREALAEGTIQPEDPDPFMSWSEIVDSLPRNRAIELGGTESKPEQDTLSSRFVPEPRYGGRVKLFIEHVLDLAQRGEPSLVVSRQSARLRELWAEQHLPQTIDPPQFIDGSLTEGFTLLPVAGPALHLFTDGEIFGWRRPEPRRRPHAVAESPEGSYTDLQIGDYVVHADHGIGVLIGLVTRTIDGSEREYLCVEYADEAQLFVPVHQADRITRYVGADARPPALSRLGSAEWKSVKSHVKEAVQEVAQDLLDLYAQRSVVEGHAFASDGPWQQELEASFPYIETDDQMRVLAEVKRDMERPQPMDRLICGDVGYGKTEVALRAAFKAVVDGKQVAVLVPTTVLAQQHTQTFHQRLAAFPVAVEMLSRFRSPQEQREVIQRLQAGGIDIVIGTHRLFSSDVKFKDLGLLVIDEEQRFGVTHKETLKKMRSEVDVLTMTATPIPRTLYMTLTGVRDISTINTPPEERLPILTHVGPYSPRLVRQAILRELERGGQVFFVHNRVQTINAMHHHLEKLVPEAKITVAHGQMHESMLSERMQQFTDGDVDVLLSTSIIESGLDIPNANTLIVDRADAFGLAQLYQLRGRVGRGAQRAYAYFFRHARRTPTLEGRERLETIAENTQLGAGYSIAMRDLEIRGAGDILGTRQHGHIAAVGFHLYTRLLTEAVHRLRSPSHREIRAIRSQAANVDLPFAASIPVDYVSDKIMRLRLYRRMADIQSQAELDALDEEFRDRFGPPPEPVRNLLYQLKIRLLSEQAGLASIGTESGQLALRYPDNQIPADLPALDSKVRVGKTAVWMPYTQWSDWRDLLVTVLNQLNGSKLVIEP